MKRDLWLRLKHYHFDHLVPPHLADHVMAAFGGQDAATRAFAGKLARKLGWTPAFARRAVEEYRKFVYLGMISETVVTPSKIIDQVWHEHLLFSKAYRDFCGEVLGRDFDHHPELASTGDQTEVFRSQFEATVALYECEFNTAPPADIWGTTKFKPGLARAKHALAGRRRTVSSDSSTSDSDTPLYLWFDGSPASGGVSYESMPEFGGGGGFSGGGGGDSWSDSHSGSSGHFDANGVAVQGSDDSGSSSDSSDSGSDSGSSDGGGSSCSSSCGGGGCGGGGE